MLFPLISLLSNTANNNPIKNSNVMVETEKIKLFFKDTRKFSSSQIDIKFASPANTGADPGSLKFHRKKLMTMLYKIGYAE